MLAPRSTYLAAATLVVAVASAADNAAPTTRPSMPQRLAVQPAQGAAREWVVRRAANGTATLLFGGRVEYSSSTTDTVGLEAFSRSCLDFMAPTLGYGPDDLQVVGFGGARMASVGLRDKMSVKYRHVWGGVPVWGSTACTIHLSNGDLVGVSGLIQPVHSVVGLESPTSLDSGVATSRSFIHNQFSDVTIETIESELILYRHEDAAPDAPHRASRIFTIRGAHGTNQPFEHLVIVDCVTGTILGNLSKSGSCIGPSLRRSQSAAHQVQVMATPSATEGPAAEGASWGTPAAHTPVEYVRVTDANTPFHVDYTDTQGVVSNSGFSNPFLLNYALGGPGGLPSNNTTDWGPSRLKIHSSSTSGVPFTSPTPISHGSAPSYHFMPGNGVPADAEFVAQANCLRIIQVVRNWYSDTRTIPRGTGKLSDAYILAVANSTTIGQAMQTSHGRASAQQLVASSPLPSPLTYYRLDFSEAGSGYANMAYSSTIAHELGHVLHMEYDLYQGTSQDGFLEGMCDAMALLSLDVDYIGKDWSGPGTYTRKGNNTIQVCPEFHTNCYGNKWANGRPLMGAIWQMQDRLQNINQPGSPDIEDVLLTSWFELFNTPVIREENRDEWLLMDDIEFDAGNGLFGVTTPSARSPHFEAINDSFEDHGWPPFEDSVFSVSHTALPHQSSPAPFVIEAAVSVGAVFASLSSLPSPPPPPTITSVEVEVAFEGSAVPGSPFTMTVNSTTGNYEYSFGASPGIGVIEYQIRVTDSNAGISQVYPPDGPLTFMIGTFRPLYVFDFDSSDMHGWTSWSAPGAAIQRTFELGSPAGKSGTNSVWNEPWHDPLAAATGPFAWGNDLGLGAYDGAYEDGEHSVLASPYFPAIPNNPTHIRVGFSRYLSLNQTDTARVYLENIVNQNTEVVWELSAPNFNFQDQEWIHPTFEVPIPNHSSVPADSRFRLVFELESSFNRRAGGWTIDDIEVFDLQASAAGENEIFLIANTVAATGDSLRLKLDGGPQLANKSFDILAGTGVGTDPHPSHPTYDTDLAAPQVVPEFQPGTYVFDSSGSAEILLPPVPVNYGNSKKFIEVVAIAGGAPVADSNEIRVAIK